MDPKCPWCKVTITDLWDYGWADSNEAEIVTECGSCEKPITLTRDIIVEYGVIRGDGKTCPTFGTAEYQNCDCAVCAK